MCAIALTTWTTLQVYAYHLQLRVEDSSTAHVSAALHRSAVVVVARAMQRGWVGGSPMVGHGGGSGAASRM
ncbi:hypothetical protein BGW80DRAFT_1414419 [Lactifluus volemus]|nr:hypothetical protein BGW80DRAFT_1414419 [Lactifluus volemus]